VLDLNQATVNRAALACTAALAMSGCAMPVVQSTPATKGQAGQTGLLYALPKAQVQLVAQRKTVDAEEVAAAKKEAADLTTAATAAQARAKEAKSATKDADDTLAAILADTAATAAAKDEVQRKANIAKAVLAVMDGRFNAADLAAKAAVVRAAAVVGELGKCTETATLAALPHAPDPDARFLAQHASSAWRDDQLTLSVSPTGLLNSASAVATDQTGQVILSLVQAFAGARVGSGSPPFKSLRLRPTEDKRDPAQACSPYKTTQVFDPTRLDEVEAAKVALSHASAGFQLCVAGLKADTIRAELKDTVPGFAYRASLPVRVTLAGSFAPTPDVCAPAANTEAASLVAHVPDASTLFVTPVTAGAFTKVSNKHTFKDGMLVEVSLDKPSMAAAIASLPVEILKALVSIPAAIIKLRVDYESQSAALATSQANVLKAQVDLLNAQKALEDRLAQDVPGP